MHRGKEPAVKRISQGAARGLSKGMDCTSPWMSFILLIQFSAKYFIHPNGKLIVVVPHFPGIVEELF